MDETDIRILAEKYSKPGPRYTSYPVAPVFKPTENHPSGPDRYISALQESSRDLSLYFHIPFCESVCYYCACSVYYTKSKQPASDYVKLIKKETDLTAEALTGADSQVNGKRKRRIGQMHFGGGTPTFLSPAELCEIIDHTYSWFALTEDTELSIELDPRNTSDEHIEALAERGFHRASLGVQDLDPVVQSLINRVQSFELISKTVEKLRSRGFHSVNFDLIYGLPGQDKSRFLETLHSVLELNPSRLSVFAFAHLPGLKPHQKRIDPEKLPGPSERLDIFLAAARYLIEQGYVYIGMDHFARPDDELAVSLKEKTLHRNFQGYTTRRGLDLTGLGITSIGELENSYWQNTKDLITYRENLENNQSANEKSYVLNDDDRIRREAIHSLICQLSLDLDRMSADFSIDAKNYFRESIEQLSELEEDGIVEITNDGAYIRVTDKGRFFLRPVCMPFDAYLPKMQQNRFSKTV